MKLLRALPLFLCVLVANGKQPPAPRIVDLTAPDGVKLKATYFSAAAPGPGLILLHQCNRQRKVWDDLASRMAAAGLNVVTVDLRGYGDSEGTPFDKLSPDQANVVFNEKFPLDIETGYNFLLAQPTDIHPYKNAHARPCFRRPEGSRWGFRAGGPNTSGPWSWEYKIARESPNLNICSSPHSGLSLLSSVSNTNSKL